MTTRTEFVTVKRDVLEQALDALWQTATPKGEEAITALSAALEQPEVEPAKPASESDMKVYRAIAARYFKDAAPQPAQQAACVTGSCPNKSGCDAAQHCCYTAPQPARKAFSDDMVLAVCRALEPSLFKDGLKPLAGDGQQWRSHMARVERSVREALEAAIAAAPQPAKQATGPEQSLRDLTSAALRICGKASDIPVVGYVILDTDMREWAASRNMHLMVSGSGHWHVMIGDRYCTPGFSSPTAALADCWNSGEYDEPNPTPDAPRYEPTFNEGSER